MPKPGHAAPAPSRHRIAQLILLLAPLTLFAWSCSSGTGGPGGTDEPDATGAADESPAADRPASPDPDQTGTGESETQAAGAPGETGGAAADPGEVAPLAGLAGLDAADPAARRDACYSLEESGPLAADHVPALAALISGEDADLARCAARVTGSAGPPALPELLRLLKTSSEPVRRIVIENAMPALPAGTGAVAELSALLEDPKRSEASRAAAAEAIGHLTHEAKDGVPALVNALADPVPRVSIAAARALGRIGRPSVRPLLKALMSEDARVRTGATAALQMVRPPPSEAVPVLASLARKDPSMKVRMSARMALEEFDTPDAKRALEEAGGALPFGRR